MTLEARPSKLRTWLIALVLAGFASCLLAGAEQASALGQITYGGCISATGSGGLCGTGNSSALENPYSIVASPDGRSLYTTAVNADGVAVFDRAPAGQITYAGCVSDDGSGGACADLPGTPLSIPVSAVVSPDGHSVYVTASGTVAVLNRASGGQLTYGGCVSNDGSSGLCADLPGAPLGVAAHIGEVAISPDGKNVYAMGADDIVVLDRASGGQLTYGGCVSNDGSGGNCADAPGSPFASAGRLAVSPEGTSVYVTGLQTSTVTVLDRAPGGQLAYAGCVSDDGSGGLCVDPPGTPLKLPALVSVSPDGRTVYVASDGGDGVAVLDRAAGGQITYAGCVSDDGSGGLCTDVPGTPLDGAFAIAVSPDGGTVYVGSLASGAITVLDRAAGGQITYAGCVSDDGSGGLCADAPGEPFDYLDSIAISPDGGSVYTASSSADTVSHLFRKTAPQTTIDSGPAEGAVITERRPTFTFSADQPGASFECSTDGGAFAACSSPLTFQPVADGGHSLAVRATTGGDADPTPARRSFQLTTAAGEPSRPGPSVRILKAPRAKVKSSRRRTRVAFAFTASDPAASFRCKLDRAEFAPCNSPKGFRVRRGRHTFVVQAVDSIGNQSPAVSDSFRVIKRTRRK